MDSERIERNRVGSYTAVYVDALEESLWARIGRETVEDTLLKTTREARDAPRGRLPDRWPEASKPRQLWAWRRCNDGNTERKAMKNVYYRAEERAEIDSLNNGRGYSFFIVIFFIFYFLFSFFFFFTKLTSPVIGREKDESSGEEHWRNESSEHRLTDTRPSEDEPSWPLGSCPTFNRHLSSLVGTLLITTTNNWDDDEMIRGRNENLASKQCGLESKKVIIIITTA